MYLFSHSACSSAVVVRSNVKVASASNKPAEMSHAGGVASTNQQLEAIATSPTDGSESKSAPPLGVPVKTTGLHSTC